MQTYMRSDEIGLKKRLAQTHAPTTTATKKKNGTEKKNGAMFLYLLRECQMNRCLLSAACSRTMVAQTTVVNMHSLIHAPTTATHGRNGTDY